jgi:hypothetical protein
VAITAIAVWLVRGQLRRPPPAASVNAPSAVSPEPAAPSKPEIEQLPPAPPAAAESGEPATADDDTDSAPPKATMTKKSGVHRRAIRRATSAKRAAGPAPAQTAPVKRKLINEL